jgi:hypothetical protein
VKPIKAPKEQDEIPGLANMAQEEAQPIMAPKTQLEQLVINLGDCNITAKAAYDRIKLLWPDAVGPVQNLQGLSEDLLKWVLEDFQNVFDGLQN